MSDSEGFPLTKWVRIRQITLESLSLHQTKTFTGTLIHSMKGSSNALIQKERLKESSSVRKKKGMKKTADEAWRRAGASERCTNYREDRPEVDSAV